MERRAAGRHMQHLEIAAMPLRTVEFPPNQEAEEISSVQGTWARTNTSCTSLEKGDREGFLIWIKRTT